MPDTLSKNLSAIAKEAGAIAQARLRDGFKQWEKSPGNPVSAVDIEVDSFLKQRLSALLPDAGWLSEETVDDPSRLNKKRLWVVDPIDGTRDYIRRRPGWAVSIALVENGQPVMGVLDAPARQEHWFAIRGQGATRNGHTLKTTHRTVFTGARVPAEHLPRVDKDLTRVARPNSIALRMAMIAAGEADVVASIRWGYEWDIAAATLIVQEAGGIVTDAAGHPLTFNSLPPDAFGVLAATAGIHAAAVNRLQARVEAVIGQSQSPGNGSSQP